VQSLLKAAGAIVALTAYCSATNVPKPDLAQALRAADTIVVARVISGNARTSATGASGEVLLRVMRVIEGEVTAGSQIEIKTQGSRFFIPGPGSKMAHSWAVEHFTALWFLRRQGVQYAVIPVTPGAGDPERASLLLPEDSSPVSQPNQVHRAVAEEIIATLRTMATTHENEIKPVYNVQMINGQVDRSYGFGNYAAKALQLNEALATLGDQPTLHAVYRELASDPAGYLRAIGIAGLIAANDPAGPKLAAVEVRNLFREAYVSPIAMGLMGYRNPEDSEAILALGRIATEFTDLDMPMLQKSAARALNALHTKETLPALIALLDSDDAEVGGLAMNGICLFVRNGPIVTPQSIPSGSWRQSREPAPFRTKDTDAYCWMNPLPASWAPPEYKAFWKTWWQAHSQEVMR
jgi:hypothetical protein